MNTRATVVRYTREQFLEELDRRCGGSVGYIPSVLDALAEIDNSWEVEFWETGSVTVKVGDKTFVLALTVERVYA